MRLFKTFGAAGTAIQDLLAHSFSSNAPMGLSEDVVRLKATLSHPGPFRTQRAAALAQFLLAQIAECAPASRDQVTEVTALHLRRLDVLIARHQKDGWTVADYAGAMSVTPGHLSRICRDATRTGAGAYIASSAMEEACRLLAFTQMNVAEVGYRVGYNDPSYFSRRFKQIRGCSPKTYRRQFTR